ncbi:MAG: hypothetical protein K0Q73_7123, partial [Paenibacillus sp.]|nr:hypothetical protein [Paenibacillus sp.]
MLWFASRLIENKRYLRSRKQEFLDLAKHFNTMDDDSSAHKLASLVIGVPYTRHFYCEDNDTSGRVESFWDIDKEPLALGSRRPGFRTKGRTSAMADHRKQKRSMLEVYLKEQEALKQDFQQLIQDGKIEFDQLPELTRAQRSKILQLMDRCLLANDSIARTEWGHVFMWFPKEGAVSINCVDGELVMPNGTLALQHRGKRGALE